MSTEHHTAAMPPDQASTADALQGYDAEAEQGLLGILLLDPALYSDLAASLQPEHFALPAHRLLYREIGARIKTARPADTGTLTGTLVPVLDGKPALIEVGGADTYLRHLADTAPPQTEAAGYVDAILDASRHRPRDQILAQVRPLLDKLQAGDLDYHDSLHLESLLGQAKSLDATSAVEPKDFLEQLDTWLPEDHTSLFQGLLHRVRSQRSFDRRDTWTGAAPARRWLIPHWLAESRISLFVGRGGRGKSRLALQLAATIAAGHPDFILDSVLGSPAPMERIPSIRREPARVVVASWEDEPAEIHRRLEELAGTYEEHSAQRIGMEAALPENLGDRLIALDLSAEGPVWGPTADGSRHVDTWAEITPTGRRLRALCEHESAELLIIDPLAAAFGSNENSRSLVRAFVADWDSWARRVGCAVMLIAHPSKNTVDFFSGSTDWFSAVRSVWTLGDHPLDEGRPANGKKGPGPQALALTCEKSSYGQRPTQKVWLRFEGGAWRQISHDTARDMEEDRQSPNPIY